jgi:PAS domain S-box-containing protein
LIALLGALVLLVAAVVLFRSRKAEARTSADADDLKRAMLENYQLILDTLDRSNVLLWWARVWREGGKLNWRIRTPPQLRDNPIFRLAALSEQGWLWREDQSPDFARMAVTSAKALAEGANGYQQEFRIIGADGVHWLSEEVIIRAVGPGEWNLAGVVTDVTKRREAEEARRSTEGQLEQILKGADCLLWQAGVTGDPDGHLDWRVFTPPSVLFRRVMGEDATPPGDRLWTREMVTEWDEIQLTCRRALREGRPDYEQEYGIKSRGQSFQLHENVSITQIGPGRWNLVGVIVDITAKRDAELALASEKERLAVTLESMSEGVITIDSRRRVLFINRAAADMTQWEAADAVGRDISDICILSHAATGRRSVLPVEEVLGGGVSAELPPQTLMKGRSDRMRLVEGRIVPVADATSRGIGAVVVLRDVTERQRMEEKLQNAAKMESIGILAGGIAHDFNNILTAILSNLTLLELDLSGMPEQAAMVDEAVRATKRAGELTLQLLTFSKGGNPVRTAVHLPDVVREAATFSLRGSGVKIEFEMPAGLWAADVDKAQIGQVIQNLVINATQAMTKGGTLRIAASNARVKPGTHAGLPAGDYVRFTVEDTGAGIAPEHLGKIFDPYFTTKVQGHGLGLATVYSIIKRHQGHIEVESAVGRGTTFTVWLPAATTVPLPQKPSKGFERAEGGGRVLFMDDEEPIRTMAEKLMERMGLDFECVADGAQAIERYKAALAAGRPFDLVVMDLTIPGGMGGKEAISVLLGIDPGVRVIVSSGYSSDLAMADFRKHGFRGMVAKPYDVSELASVIRSVLAERRQPV